MPGLLGVEMDPAPRCLVTLAGSAFGWLASRDAKMAPEIVTPNEPPTERKKVAVEVATPTSSGLASFCTRSMSTCMTSPLPTPTTSM